MAVWYPVQRNYLLLVGFTHSSRLWPVPTKCTETPLYSSALQNFAPGLFPFFHCTFILYPNQLTTFFFKYLSCMWFSLQTNICKFLCLHSLTRLNLKYSAVKTKLLPKQSPSVSWQWMPTSSPSPGQFTVLVTFLCSLSFSSPQCVFPLCACPCPCTPPLCLSSFWLLLSLPFCCSHISSSSLLWILFHYFCNLPIAWKIIHVFQNHSISVTSFVLCTKLHFFLQLRKKPVTANKSDAIHRTLTKSRPFVCYSSPPQCRGLTRPKPGQAGPIQISSLASSRPKSGFFSSLRWEVDLHPYWTQKQKSYQQLLGQDITPVFATE